MLDPIRVRQRFSQVRTPSVALTPAPLRLNGCSIRFGMIRAPKKLAALEAPKQQPEFCRTNSDTGTAYAARLDRGATQLTQPIVSREVGAPPPHGFLSGVLHPQKGTSKIHSE